MRRTELRRSPPPERRTPLPRGGSLTRTAPLPRAATVSRPTARNTDPTTSTRTVVYARDGHACIRCGATQPLNLHHRRPRGAGGSRAVDTNLPQNLLLLCGSGTAGCHGWVEHNRTEAWDVGWLVRQGHDPATIPVLLADGRHVYLTADGGYADTLAVAS